MCVYIHMSLLLYVQNTYGKLQPPLLILKCVTQRFNHWNIFCLDEFVGFFFIILKEILKIYHILTYDSDTKMNSNFLFLRCKGERLYHRTNL